MSVKLKCPVAHYYKDYTDTFFKTDWRVSVKWKSIKKMFTV